MRYGIFSDVHSNLEALEAVLAYLNAQRVDRLICAGDVVGYGADPGRCLKRLRDNGVVCVAGNHDWAVAGRLDSGWFNPQARRAVEWTALQLDEDEKAFLTRLPLVWQEGPVTVVHSSLYQPHTFPYILDLLSAQRSLSVQETPWTFMGHTHLPGFFLESEGKVQFLSKTTLRIQRGMKVLVNVGSVGQPRDGDPRSACCLLDTDTQVAEIHRVPYPIEPVQRKIRQAGLPEPLAERLAWGY
jgi:predicted phosphodiesterase